MANKDAAYKEIQIKLEAMEQHCEVQQQLLQHACNLEYGTGYMNMDDEASANNNTNNTIADNTTYAELYNFILLIRQMITSVNRPGSSFLNSLVSKLFNSMMKQNHIYTTNDTFFWFCWCYSLATLTIQLFILDL